MAGAAEKRKYLRNLYLSVFSSLNFALPARVEFGGAGAQWTLALPDPADTHGRAPNWQRCGSPAPPGPSSIGRMGLAITLTTMFGPPVVYGAWNTYALEQRARQLATVGARHLEAQLSLSLVGNSLSLAAINVLQATSIASPAVTATWVTNRQGSVPDGRPYRLP